MAKKGGRQVVRDVRRMNNFTGVPEELAQLIQGARLRGSPEQYQRVLKRAVTQGYLMRKNNKYYFIPSRKMQLPSLVVMRRRGRRKTRRARRGRSRRRTAKMYLEAVRNRSPARRRRSARRRRHMRRRTAAGSGAQQQVEAGTSGTQSSPKMTVERKPSATK